MNVVIDGTVVSLELLESQKYRNMEVIPVKVNNNGNNDYLTLKRGIRAGFVEVTECEVSTVGAVLARNNADIPLVLIDGDEIVGAKQNRIMNRSLIIPPKTTMHVSVSCTEQGRWHYGRTRRDFVEGIDYVNRFENLDVSREHFEDFDDGEERENFECSDFAADFSTRSAKSDVLFENRDCQSTVWKSISDLEDKTSFKSRTSALNDNYEKHRHMQDEYLRHFKLEFAQSGAIFIINGQIKGFELFYNPIIYQDYHEKIFRSYIMEAITNTYSAHSSDVSYYVIEAFLREISSSDFRCSENRGIGKHMNFANKYGTGSILMDGGNLVHINYFNSSKFNPKHNRARQSRRYGSFRDFADNFD